MGTKAKTEPAGTAEQAPAPAETTPLIHGKMAQLMEEVGVITKTKAGPGYKFRGIDDVLEHLQPALIKLRLSLGTKVVGYSTSRYEEQKPGSNNLMRTINTATVHQRICIFAEDGSYRELEAVADGLDYGSDKGPNKAMSASFKYALLLGLSIPTKDLEDNDQEISGKGDGNGHGSPFIAPPAGVPTAPPAAIPTAPAPPTSPPPSTPAAPPVAPAAQPLAQPTNPADGRTEIDDALASPERIAELAEAANAIGMPKDALDAAIERRGAQTPAQLTTKQIRELILAIRAKATEVQAAQVFG